MKKVFMYVGLITLMLFAVACGNQDSGNDANNGNGQNENTVNTTNNEANQDGNTETEKENKSTNDDTNEDIDEATNQDDMKKMMEQLNFYEIEVEVSYGPDKEYEAEIENHSNGDIEAEVEDELNNVDLDDDVEAFNHIYPKAKKLTISKDMEKDEVIKSVLEAFDLEDNYEKFEVEFEFEDGSKLSFEDKK